MKAPLMVPVRLTGGVMHDTDYARGADSREEADEINAKLYAELGHHHYGVDYVMEPVEPFTARLKALEVGHKNAYVWLIGRDGLQYPMFTRDLVTLLSTANVTDGWIEEITYEVCKKGARAYGIRPVA